VRDEREKTGSVSSPCSRFCFPVFVSAPRPTVEGCGGYSILNQQAGHFLHQVFHLAGAPRRQCSGPRVHRAGRPDRRHFQSGVELPPRFKIAFAGPPETKNALRYLSSRTGHEARKHLDRRTVGQIEARLRSQPTIADHQIDKNPFPGACRFDADFDQSITASSSGVPSRLSIDSASRPKLGGK